jgi:hypothetical protein
MKQHVLRVKLNEDGQWADIPFYANALGLAIKQAEAQYGRGCLLGVIMTED